MAASPSSSSQSGLDEREKVRQALLALDKQKEEIETELSMLVADLRSGRPTGENGGQVFVPGISDKEGSLVDADGFPRAGIDIWDIRTKRQRVNVLQTDYSSVMAEIESKLACFYAFAPPKPDTSMVTKEEDSPQAAQASSVVSSPFARVNEVAAGSPAEEAGMRVGDLIIDFEGELRSLDGISSIVGSSIGRTLRVIVLRSGADRVVLELTPRAWSGRGVLGCHLLPL